MTTSTIRPMTEAVVVSLVLDAPITPSQRTDFGVTDDDHYRALRAALDAACTELGEDAALEQLDGVLGKGPAITAFVYQYAPEWGGLRFTTDYDGLLKRGGNADQ